MSMKHLLLSVMSGSGSEVATETTQTNQSGTPAIPDAAEAWRQQLDAHLRQSEAVEGAAAQTAGRPVPSAFARSAEGVTSFGGFDGSSDKVYLEKAMLSGIGSPSLPSETAATQPAEADTPEDEERLKGFEKLSALLKRLVPGKS